MHMHWTMIEAYILNRWNKVEVKATHLAGFLGEASRAAWVR